MMSYTGGIDLGDLLDMPLKRTVLPPLYPKAVPLVRVIS